ncbi:isocitrate lyase/phosphoenolpyruvate mutase family protein [Oxalobacteraceae bacterium]|nr:isocitrate lyase/phosphoenolpyruvate mutase family protein [Oxalobacteraceae bacterium]
MSSQTEKAAQFHALHVSGRPLVLFNAWDAGSAKAVAAGGALAIATGSWSVAAANGYADGEKIPLDLVIDNLARIVKTVALPVTFDLESGYGKTLDAVAAAAQRAMRAGAIGSNLEDSFPENGALRPADEQARRLAAIRAAAEELSLPFFINARTDVFLNAAPETHDEAMLSDVIARAQVYADAGANGFFAPGLADSKLIARLVKACPLPVNIMVSDRTPSLTELAELGVARASHGPRPYLQMMKALEAAARAAMVLER